MQQETVESNPTRIIRARAEHIALLVPLFDAYRQFYHQATDREGAQNFLAQRFAEDSSVIFLAVTGEEEAKQIPCGFTQLYPTFSSVSMKRLWILNDLFVIPEVRRQRIARKLLERAQAFALETHAKGLTLQTAIDNHTAQALYESSGWRREERFFSYNLSVGDV